MPARRDLLPDQLNDEIIHFYGLDNFPKPDGEELVTKPEDVIKGIGETELSHTIIVLSPDDGAPEVF